MTRPAHNAVTVHHRAILFYHHHVPIIPGTRRDRLAGEVEPLTASQSQTRYNNEAWFGAGRAVDRNWTTYTRAVPGRDGVTWFQVSYNLGAIL